MNIYADGTTRLYELSETTAGRKGVPSSFIARALKETPMAVYLYGPGVDCWIPKYAIKLADPNRVQEAIEVPDEHPMFETTAASSDGPQRYAKISRIGPARQRMIKIVFPYDWRDITNVKKIKGARYQHEVDEKFFVCPISVDAVTALDQLQFALSPKLLKLLNESQTNVDQIEAVTVPGLQGKLYPFQEKGVAYTEFKNGMALLADDMGLGKTVQALSFLQLHPELRPAVIVVPASLKLNWAREARRWMERPRARVLSGSKANPRWLRGEILIINYDILANKYEKYIDKKDGKKKEREQPFTGWVDYIKNLNPKVVILDECFPAGTLISTPRGEVPIEQLKEGDSIYNALGVGNITKKGERFTHHLVRITMNNGKQITCTPNHPFFTTEGWYPAENLAEKFLLTPATIFNILERDDILRGDSDHETASREPNLPMVQKTIQSHPQHISQTKILREVLLSEVENVTTFNKEGRIHEGTISENVRRSPESPRQKSTMGKRQLRTHDEEQPHHELRGGKKDKGTLEEIRASLTKTTAQRRERQTPPRSPKNFTGSFRIKMEGGICNPHSDASIFLLPDSLQSRFRTTPKQALDRVRRMDSRTSRNRSTRPKEGTIPARTRVERVEIFEYKSSARLGGRLVYNLEVSGHPSYYAEGVLVHNCQFIKNSAAHRTKAVKKLVQGVPHVLGLTGTAIENRPAEIYNIIRIVCPALFPDRFSFLRRYCAGRHTGWGWDFSGASNTKELHQKLINSCMLRRRKADVLPELPAKIRSVVPIELDLTAAKLYRKAESDFIGWVRETRGHKAAKRASNAEALTRIEGLKQLAVKAKMTQMVRWIKDFLEVKDKLVIFAEHKEVVNQLMADLTSYNPVVVAGGVSKENRQRAVDRFQTEDNVRVILGSKSLAMGWTLTAAADTCFTELWWTPGLHVQAEDRVHRIGQEADSVNAYYLIATETIEEEIAALLDKKRKVLDQVLDGIETDDSSLLTELMNAYS